MALRSVWHGRGACEFRIGIPARSLRTEVFWRTGQKVELLITQSSKLFASCFDFRFLVFGLSHRNYPLFVDGTLQAATATVATAYG